MGLTVAALALCVVEGILHVALGPPPPPVTVYSTVGDLPRYLERKGELVYPAYQLGALATPPFPATAEGPRIAVLGGSSVHRGPPDLEFAALLQQRLGVTTLNLGAPGLDSHDVLKITRELVELSPAAVVVYTGHNDVGNAYFHERYRGWVGYGSAMLLPLLERSRIFGLLNRTLSAPQGERFGPGDDLGGSQGDARAALRWDGRIHTIERHFEANLEAVVSLCERHGVLAVLVTPVTSLIARPVSPDCPTTPCARQLWAQARQVGPQDPASAAALLRQARDLDLPPSRASSAMVQAVREVAEDRGALLVDAERELPQGRVPVPAPHLFDDHIHFSAQGHAAMAALLAQALEGRPELGVAP
jgi:lysophospholipase L1-like esterase